MGVNSNGTTLMDQGVFQNIGSVTWDTTAKTTGFTAVSGNGYFVNTTSGAITVTLPSSPSAGDVVGIKDYANTADTNNITLGRNGSNIDGVANDAIINTEGLSALIVYVDATKGWLITNSSQANDISEGPTYIVATGGTVTCCGDYKIHTFTSPGTFTVCSVGNCATPSSLRDKVEYLVVAGGGGGGSGGVACSAGGGGGAGGYRTNFPTCSGFTVTATTFPISIGGGGAGGVSPGCVAQTNPGVSGSNSIFSTITSTGGGGGGNYPASPGNTGGSGGGGGCNLSTGGSGNTPPVSPPQGNPGYIIPGAACYQAAAGGGGGGATVAGGQSNIPGGGPSFTGYGGAGGAGASNSITGSSVSYAGGGGGGGNTVLGAASPCGTGGAGAKGKSPVTNATAGTTNRGGGGGGGSQSPPGGSGPNMNGANGGSGIVIIRYKYQ